MNSTDATEKLYYLIKEVATETGEPESTLRYWESKFPDILKPKKNEHGVRYYSKQDIEDVRLVQFLLRDRKMKVEGARQQLKTNRDAVNRDAKIITHLRHIKDELRGLEKELAEVERMD
ncbi:MAG: MerR family transcriptional regulator [Tannerella sp.]|jgi:DNA-binding transcriptional MerR regulator|nr:MerR family transcriptional regulator [Tannerella sp.]